MAQYTDSFQAKLPARITGMVFWGLVFIGLGCPKQDVFAGEHRDRIRAVQDFTASQATAVILKLKKILRDCLADELRDASRLKELLAFESRIDQLSLLAFDLYMNCREKIYEIAAHETRNQTFRAFKRAGLIVDPSQAPRKQKGVKP